MLVPMRMAFEAIARDRRGRRGLKTRHRTRGVIRAGLPALYPHTPDMDCRAQIPGTTNPPFSGAVPAYASRRFERRDHDAPKARRRQEPPAGAVLTRVSRQASGLHVCLTESHGSERCMMKPTETEVLARAKAAAAQDGLTWEFDFTATGEQRGSLRGQHFLSEDRRQQYLARAREELRKEAGGECPPPI